MNLTLTDYIITMLPFTSTIVADLSSKKSNNNKKTEEYQYIGIEFEDK